MHQQNDILELCLERLAQGDTVENCLADYPQEAAELRPLLQAAQQLHSLSPQQPSVAADKQIEQRLRRAVRQREEKKSPWQRPFSMESILMKTFFRFIPRVALGVIVLGLLVFFLAKLPIRREPEVEPMVSATAITSTNTDNIQVEADLSADPGTVPLYRIFTAPVPDTPETMLAYARDFGLPEPALYRRSSGDDPTDYVIGSDGRRLLFQHSDGFNQITFVDPITPISGEPLPFAQASQIAIDFLQSHNLLPTNFTTDLLPYEFYSNGLQTVVIRWVAGDGIIGDLNAYGSSLHVTITANGQVTSAVLPQLLLEEGEAVSIISAQEAYEKLLAGHVAGSARGEIRSYNQAEQVYYAPTDWQVGDSVAVMGYLELLVGVNNNQTHITFTGFNGAATYDLVGDQLTDLLADVWPELYLVQGEIVAQTDADSWQLAVQSWQHVSYHEINCLTGEWLWQGENGRFRSDNGPEYGVPNAPLALTDGERTRICLRLPDEPTADLDWSLIQPEAVLAAGGLTNGPISTQEGGVVEQVVSVEVTRMVSDIVVGEAGETAVTSLQPIPTEAPFTEPESPYQMGDSVELIGYIQGIRLINDAGEAHYELQLVSDQAYDSTTYFLPYPLIAPPELMAEMAAFADLHIRVRGGIVTAPESRFYNSLFGQAIAVESFDRPWPEEKLENFLGHFLVEELEGQLYMIFTDHETNQRYVVDPQYPLPEDYDRDVRFDEEQGLLTAVIHPAADPIGGLPVMLNRGFATGIDITLATDASRFPLPTDRLGTMKEAFLQGNEISENDIIERVELVYPYDAYVNRSVITAPPIEPVWVFYGRNAQGTIFFTMNISAVK